MEGLWSPAGKLEIKSQSAAGGRGARCDNRRDIYASAVLFACGLMVGESDSLGSGVLIKCLSFHQQGTFGQTIQHSCPSQIREKTLPVLAINAKDHIQQFNNRLGHSKGWCINCLAVEISYYESVSSFFMCIGSIRELRKTEVHESAGFNRARC